MSLRSSRFVSFATFLCWALPAVAQDEAVLTSPEASTSEVRTKESSHPPADDSAAGAESADEVVALDPFYARFDSAASYLSSLDLAPPATLAENAGAGSDATLRPDEQTYAFRVLYELNRLSDSRLAAWNRLAPLPYEVEGPAPSPLATIRWEGVVETVDAVPVPEDLYLEMDRAYVLHVRPQDASSAKLRILVSQVPKVWLDGAAQTEASGYALYLRSTSGGDGRETPLQWAVGDPPIWRPSAPDERLGVTPSHVALAQAGVNVASLEGLRRRNKAEFASDDNEPFYGFLRATSATTAEQRRALEREVKLTDLLVDADRFVGEAVRFPARVRRITEIHVENPRAVETIGQENYWQLDLVYDLDGQPIRMRGRNGEDIVFKSTFPATVCALSLPPAVEAAWKDSIKRGEGGVVNRRAIVEGYFYRLWAFPTEQTRAGKTDALQFGPLVIGTIVSVQPAALDSSWIWWAAVPGVLFLAGVLYFIWRTTRGDSINDRVRVEKLRRDAAKLSETRLVPRPIGPPISWRPHEPTEPKPNE